MPRRKTDNTPVTEEKAAQKEAEALAHHASEASLDESATNIDEEAEKALAVEEGADVDQVIPAEVAAVHVGNETARAANAAGDTKEKSVKKVKASKPAKAKKASRSAKYAAAKAHIEVGKVYKLEEAIELAKKVSVSTFDGALELHLRLVSKKSKGATESQRGIFNLPHGSGKSKKVIVLDEKKIEQIAKTKKIDFDIAIATPALMPKVAQIAKILGPKGKMPDPKSGTVTDNPEAVIKEINSGKVEYRIDAHNNIHQVIGRVSWDSAKLVENAKAVLTGFQRTRLLTVTICPSIGPAVALDLTSL